MDPNCKELKLKSVSNTQLNLHSLTEEQKVALERQDSRTVSSFRSEKFDKEAKKHWDIFYKRNENRFFKDRHWTTREFWELCNTSDDGKESSQKILTEIGCGVGNFAFPLLEDKNCNLFIYACDFSPRAVDIVKSNSIYEEDKIGKIAINTGSCDPIFYSYEQKSIDFIKFSNERTN